MKIKPRYHQIRARDITVGMHVYSGLLGRCFTVDSIGAHFDSIELRAGECYKMRLGADRLRWVMTS